MKIPVKKATFQISFIQCGNWHSTNLLSEGLFIEGSQEGTTAVITFFLDTSINQRTRDKESSTYLDSLTLAEKIEDFQYLTISDDTIISVLSSKVKNLSSKVKCVLDITVKPSGDKKQFVIQPSVSGEVKLTRVIPK